MAAEHSVQAWKAPQVHYERLAQVRARGFLLLWPKAKAEATSKAVVIDRIFAVVVARIIPSLGQADISL